MRPTARRTRRSRITVAGDRRPSPAILALALALALLLAGSAVAGSDALTAKITKSKVKKIARKQIAKAAPGLSVRHAENAGRASSAADSGAVGGFAPGSLIRTAGASTANASESGAAVSTAIEAPGPGFLTIFATADWSYGSSGDQVECFLEIDDVRVPDSARISNINGNGAVEVDSVCATNATRPVAAGSHKVDVEIAQVDNGSVGAAGVSVIYTPFNSTGGVG